MSRRTPVKPASSPTVPAANVQAHRADAGGEVDRVGLGSELALSYRMKAGVLSSGLAETEWLLTNGLGGFAMGSAAGVPLRRYHALLIAATRPPVGRVAVLNAMVDRLVIDPDAAGVKAVELSGFRFAGLGDRVHPDGPSRLESFSRGRAAAWVYTTPAARITRSVQLMRGENTVTIEYTVERVGTGTGVPLRLTARPLVSLRDFHGLIRRTWADRFSLRDVGARGLRVERDGISAVLRSEPGKFRADPQWWHDFFYAIDADRRQDCVEDLYSPGEFSIDLAPGEACSRLLVRAGLEDQGGSIDDELARDHKARRRHIEGLIAATNAARAHACVLGALTIAADGFVVARVGEKGKGVRLGEAGNPGEAGRAGVSIIAGYPWFGDWGRDTFVSLPGLLLATGRLDEARETLRVFAAHRRNGLIPNLFNEHTGEAEYNTVDAPLWFIHSACAYVEAGGDRAFWKSDLAPACLDIVATFRRGIGGEANIAMDPFDKLVTAGTSATQLTWMDARRDGVVFTPRFGKAVEINALWISGLRRLSGAIGRDDSQAAANLNDLGETAARSFRKSFWNEHGAGGCLYDCLTPSESSAGQVAWTPDGSIRPNQIFAVSLPHSPLASEAQRAVVRVVKERLWTARGVRTLDPVDPRYRGRYEGDLFQRDGAYHNGTAWPWLLGPLAEAVMRAEGFSAASRAEARQVLMPIVETLTPGAVERGGCVGQIAEIYDGDAPQRPQGCVAQAWSVAETLRVWRMIEAG
ncbi:MAG: glycogen debranching enzyme family protein [Phycisphaerales bacterium]|nr:glycogen debranching enzyme family protein [Phycisphaerales bacterium]